MSSPDIGRQVESWWQQHVADRQSGQARGLAARLRRRTAIEVLAEPAVHKLADSLHTRDAERLLRLVRVLAELRGTSATSLPRLLGRGDPKPLSTARFQTVMRGEGDELTTALIRAIRGLGAADARACNIAALARDLWFWDDATRARWTFEYFAAPVPETLTPAAPHPDSEETLA